MDVVESLLQSMYGHVVVLNTVREMETTSREDQKEKNKEPTRKSSEIPTRRDTSTGAGHVETSTLSPFLSFLPFLASL